MFELQAVFGAHFYMIHLGYDMSRLSFVPLASLVAYISFYSLGKSKYSQHLKKQLIFGWASDVFLLRASEKKFDLCLCVCNRGSNRTLRSILIKRCPQIVWRKTSVDFVSGRLFWLF